VRRYCQDRVDATVKQSERNLLAAIKKFESQLQAQVRTYNEVDYSPETLDTYQHKLCEFIDKKFSSALETDTKDFLTTLHEQTKNEMVGEWRSL